MTEHHAEHSDFFVRNMPDALPPVVPTQVARPWRATWRTVVQVGIPAFIVLLGILPEVLQLIISGMGDHLTPGIRLALAGAATFITAMAGTLARIAAIPRVNEALKVIRLSADGRGRHVG
jgi:hypothetical protein